MVNSENNLTCRIATILRVIAAVHLTYGFYYDFVFVKPPTTLPHYSKGGKFKYMTTWNLCLEALYFWFAILDSVVSGCNENEKKPLRKLRDSFFLSITFPLSFFVAFTFWVLYAIDRELVMPKAVDEFFPTWLNHTVHTFILFYSVLELFTSYHKSASTIIKQCYLLWTITIAYMIWCHVVFYKTNLWVYPILNNFNLFGRMLFFAGCLVVATTFLAIGYHTNNTVWKKRVQVSKTQKSKKLQ